MKDKVCAFCGRRFSQYLETGYLGCPECYESFNKEIAAEMEKNGVSGKYSGSMPKRLSCFRNSLTDRTDLQAKLEEAVKSENYEKAAVYRDFLRALEHGSVARGSESDFSSGAETGTQGDTDE